MEQVKYTVRVVKGGQTFLPLMAAFGAGMSIMFVLVILGVNTFITTLALLIVMALVVLILIYDGEYVLDDAGIKEKITPTWSPFGWQKVEERFFDWQKVKAYKISVDGYKDNISFQEYGQKVIFEIYFHDTNYKVVFNNGKTAASRVSFGDFVDAFIAKTEEINLQENNTMANENTGIPIIEHHSEQNIPRIERKKSFYEKPIAKIISVLFIVITVGLIYFISKMNASDTSWFKLFFILIPGTLYMVYRSFYNPRFHKK